MTKHLRIAAVLVAVLAGSSAWAATESSVLVEQQVTTCQGNVKDALGEPVIGASIFVKGTKNGTVTDVNGDFSLSGVKVGDVLEISCIGYATAEVKYTGGKVAVLLNEDTTMLDELVVVGYGTQKKLNVTGSIATVKADEIAKVPVSNLSNSLAGRAPGVTIVGNTGFAGASSSIRMRGATAEPLYVINDVIKDKAAFDALDANEIETISFLKDAASSAIYGSKAGNGVVVVTTKTGAKQKPVFNYTGSYSFSNPTRPLQDWTSEEEVNYLNQVAINLGNQPAYGQEALDWAKTHSYSVNDYVWQNPSVWQHNVSVNGGGDRITYYMMLGFHDEKGSYKTLDYDKYNFRSNISAKVTDHFKITFNLAGNLRHDHRFYWPYDDVENYTVPDFYRTTFNWSRLYPFYTDAEGNPTTERTQYPVIQSSWNPVEMVLADRYWDTDKRSLDGQLRFDLDLGEVLKGLSTTFLASYNAYDQKRKAFITHNIGYVFNPASTTNPLKPAAPSNMTSHNLSANYPCIQEYASFSHDMQLNWFLRYDRTFGKHTVNATAIYEQEQYSGWAMNGKAEDPVTTSIDQIFVMSTDPARDEFGGSESMSARQSVIGRLSYNYADKYMAEFSFREDGNYKFGPGYRWGFFPSFSLGWRISEENFMQNVDWVNNLKLRASYGSTGDDSGINAFNWREYYSNGSSYAFGGAMSNGLTIGNTPNPFMTWATVSVYDAGIDYSLLKGRLTGEIDGFYKDRTDILRSRNNTVPDTYGASLAQENYAEQDFRGFEISARWDDNIGSDIHYAVYANMGYSKDRWVFYDETEGLQEWRSGLGKPNDRVQGYRYVKMLRTQSDIDALPAGFTQFGKAPKLGTLLYEDIRGADYSEGPDGKVDSWDKDYLSDNGAPRINYGFGFSFSWKGLSLDAHFQGVGGYDRMIGTMNGGVFQSGRPYFELWARDTWTPETPNATYPMVTGAWLDPLYGGDYSTFWLRNGAYCRLKNLNIAYQLPKNWLSKLGVDSCSIYVNGTNLFSIDGMKEMDPEQNTLDSYPIMRTFTTGLSINF